MGSLQFQRVSKNTIKPSCPTPPHLQNYNFSLLDQLTGRDYRSRVLFYSTHGCNGTSKAFELKKSLSETLNRYYPFAGRIRHDGLSIDCNDEGVEFLEFQVQCQLSDVLKQPKFEALHMLFPDGVLGNNSYNGSLVVIQLSLFQCGGMAIAVCLSHKLGDGGALAAFMNDWAAMARQPGEGLILSPHFISPTLSSPANDPISLPEIELEKENCVTRRYVFDASKLAELKVMASDSGLHNPTRVEVVTALLYKCAMAASRENSASPKPSILIQVVNMRPRMVPPLPSTSVGNFSWHFTISTMEERETKLQELVGELRRSMNQFFNNYVKNVSVNEWFSVIRRSMEDTKGLYDSSSDVNVYKSSSMCRYPLYEVDFGWGKPIWVGVPGNTLKNTFALLDTPKGGGIEAWVTLDEQDMAAFELDKDLLAFASLNPSVLDTA